MSPNKEHLHRLTRRERELTAIGAAIASNCVPCIEYHIPQARKAGLSDSQIREAVELADKVRRVPADKVLQTAHALLLDNSNSEEDNEVRSKSCDDRAGDGTKGCGAEIAEEGQPDSADKPGFDRLKMMQMMGECCPEKMKDFSSMMDASMSGCCSTEEESGPKASGAAKPTT